jgi:hypothetical protein
VRVALITGSFGGYDPVRDLPEWHGFDDAVCVTDTASGVGDGWRVHVEPGSDNPRLASKRPKMMPWLFTDCDAAVWMDASFELTGRGFRSWVDGHLERNDFTAWVHPEGRTCIQQEADVCWFFKKYEGEPIRDQARSYFRDGFPRFWGLFAAGALGWVFSPEANGLGNSWYRECEQWSIQDQISLPYLLWSRNMRFGLWRGNEYKNDFLKLHWGERKDWGVLEGLESEATVSPGSPGLASQGA